ncbi:hypothetical protein L3V83_06155 [Thiotrichales bacterium 19X7-9]|nr:hypothetical protein [Thiotrichales bacterium 19X7-9]
MLIIDAMEELGYKPRKDKSKESTDGVCWGIAAMAAQAHARGEFDIFQRRIEFIHSIAYEKEIISDLSSSEENIFKHGGIASIKLFAQLKASSPLIDQIEDAENRRRLIAQGDKKIFLTDHDELLLSIKPFFEGIALYMNCLTNSQDPDKSLIEQNFLPLQDFQNIDIANSVFNENNQRGPISGEKEDRGIYVQSESIRFFTKETLKEYIEKAFKEEGSSINIENANHVVNLGKNGDQYCLISHDYMVVDRDLDKVISGLLDHMEANKDQEIIVNAKIISPNKPENGIAKDYKEVTIKELSKSTSVGSLFYFALKIGHAEAIESYMDIIKVDYLKDKKQSEEMIKLAADEQSRLSTNLALKNSRDKKVKAILEATADGSNGLYIALLDNHLKAVQAYIKGLNNLDLDQSIKVELLLAKDSKGIPGALAAFEKGSSELINVYLEGVKHLNLNNTEVLKEFILPGLSMALAGGCSKAVKGYLQWVKDLDIKDKELLKEVLQANDEGGDSALYNACVNNSKAVNAYISGIIELNLEDEALLKELLQAKNSDGNSIVTVAYCSDDDWSQELKTYIEGFKEVAIDQELLKELLLSEENGCPQIYHAFAGGHTEVVKAYIEGIKSLNLEPNIVKELLLAKYSNYPTIGYAHHNKHHETVQAFIDGIKSLELPKETVIDLVKELEFLPESDKKELLSSVKEKSIASIASIQQVDPLFSVSEQASKAAESVTFC